MSHFLSHVDLHFRNDLASSSFLGQALFDEEVLARVVAASREDSHLDVQLSIAKAFTLPVFQGARNSDWKPLLIRNLWHLLPLLPEIGEEVLQNHVEGRTRLPLVRLRVILLSLLAVVSCCLPNGRVFRSIG